MNSEHLAVRFGDGKVYEGYPTTRLVLDDLPEDLNSLELPEGPWKMQSLELPTPEQSAKFVEAGYEVDSLGRPIHPWFRQMATNPEIGVVTGNGFYYHWGPNLTADPIVITTEERPRVLLITRKDTGKLAFPGGFVDPGEDDHTVSALRELGEETKLLLTKPDFLVYQGVVADIRTTANSWAETSAYLFTVDTALPVKARSDAKKAAWYYIDELGNDLFGSHRTILDMALEMHTKANRRTVEEVLQVPKEEQEITVIDAGHMAYNHYFTKHAHDHLFVKAHIAERFTDPFREAHSRTYLQKEHTVVAYVQERGFGFAPERMALVEDHLLAMDALHEEHGWSWKAPQDEQFEAYVTDALKAFDQLQQIQPLENAPYHADINPTYPTLWTEGWDAIDDEALDVIIGKARLLSTEWSDAQKIDTEQLIALLPELRQVSAQLDHEPELFMAHNDARQSNLAWRAGDGIRLVDWSWADKAPKNADHTMLLIDLAKAGHDVSPWLDSFNRDHALVLVGFWLEHSRWETRDGSTTVREHQLASAVAALKILLDHQG